MLHKLIIKENEKNECTLLCRSHDFNKVGQCLNFYLIHELVHYGYKLWYGINLRAWSIGVEANLFFM